MRDYRNYHYSPRERLRYFLEAAVWIALVSDLFYHSWLALCLFIPFYPVYLKIRAELLLLLLQQPLCPNF